MSLWVFVLFNQLRFTMNMQFPCSGCQKPLRVPQSYLGKSIKCPQCGHLMTAATSAGPSAVTAAAPPLPMDPAASHQDRHPRTQETVNSDPFAPAPLPGEPHETKAVDSNAS